MKIAYIMSRFPKLTETFILYEIIAQEQRAMDVSIYPLLRHSADVSHPEAEAFVKRARYAPFVSIPIIQANWKMFARSPRRYLGTFSEALRGTFGNLNFFAGALGIFPKTVLFATRMQEEGVEHLHAHFGTHPALAALIVHRLTGIPFSFTVHGSDLHKDQRMLATKIAAAEFVITVSDFNRNFIAERCGERTREKVKVIHCGVDTQFFRPRVEPRRPGPLRILCVASFEEVKGHRYLIEACETLRSIGSDFECHLVGSGPLKANLERQISAAGLDAYFRLHGPRTRPEVRERLWNSDVVVLASVPTSSGQREGVPVALMEAMACGIPVVSSNMSGIPELVTSGKSGVLLPPGDSTAIGKTLVALSRDPEWAAALGRAAREKILAQFDLCVNADRLADLFLTHQQQISTITETVAAA
jgi:colanic acid/amylovoran biosynthesis glycosyltransferase